MANSLNHLQILGNPLQKKKKNRLTELSVSLLMNCGLQVLLAMLLIVIYNAFVFNVYLRARKFLDKFKDVFIYL